MSDTKYLVTDGIGVLSKDRHDGKFVWHPVPSFPMPTDAMEVLSNEWRVIFDDQESADAAQRETKRGHVVGIALDVVKRLGMAYVVVSGGE